MRRNTICRTFWKTFCLMVLSAAVFMALLTAGSRQKPKTRQQADSILVRVPDEHVTDFAVSASTPDCRQG